MQLQWPARNTSLEDRRSLVVVEGLSKQVWVLLPHAEQGQDEAHALLERSPVHGSHFNLLCGWTGWNAGSACDSVLDAAEHGALCLWVKRVEALEQIAELWAADGL